MFKQMFKKKRNKLSVTKEHRPRMDWQKRTAIIVLVLNCLLVCGLGVNAYLVNGELRHLKNQMTYLSDTSSVILSGVDTMRADIEQTLQEEASLIEDWSVELKQTNFAMGTYRVAMTVIPKEYTEKTQVEMYFGTNKFGLQLENFKFVGEAQLSLNHRYDGNVTVLLVNGKKKNTEVLAGYQDIQNGFEEILSGSIKEIPKFENGVMRVNQDFAYNISDKNKFGFTEFQLVIESDGQVLDAFDLFADSAAETKSDTPKSDMTGNEKGEKEKTENTKTGNEKSDIAKIEDASDGENLSKENTEISTESDDAIEELEPVYLLNGSYYVKEHYEVEEGSQIRIYLKGVCQEGFTFTYDLFRGITQEGAVKEFADAEDYFAPNARVYDALGYWRLDE